jgi:hypothetical protein
MVVGRAEDKRYATLFTLLSEVLTDVLAAKVSE